MLKLLKTKIFGLFILMILTSIVCLSIGSVNINVSEVMQSLINYNSKNVNSVIIWDIRLPRILLALAVGGGLSVAGAVFQSILMNPLAEPFILGISSGGAFGAILSILLGLSFVFTQSFAFLGAIAVVLLVFMLGQRFGELEPNILLLTGVMVGSFFSAAILFMMTILGDSLRSAVFWMIGNLSLAESSTIVYVLPIALITSFFLSINSHKYNVLSLGTEHAKNLGINTKKLKTFTYIITSLLVGVLVSVSGIIGFVGLLIPHLCRLLFGVDNRIIVPASFFIGGIYLMVADTLARTIIAPEEIPVGAITALIGAPLFIYLLRKRVKIFS